MAKMQEAVISVNRSSNKYKAKTIGSFGIDKNMKPKLRTIEKNILIK